MASGHALSIPALRAFSSVLTKNKSLRKLGLGDENLGDDNAAILFEGLGHEDCELQTLEMDVKGLGPLGAAALGKAMLTNKRLLKLNLARNMLLDDGVRSLCEGIRKGEGCLREMDLTEVNVGDAGVEALSALLKEDSCVLEILKIAGNEGVQARSNALLWEAIGARGSDSKLRELSLGGCVGAWDVGCVEKMDAALKQEGCSLSTIVLDSAPFGTLGELMHVPS